MGRTFLQLVNCSSIGTLINGSRVSIVTFLTKGYVEDIGQPMPSVTRNDLFGPLNDALSARQKTRSRIQKLTKLRTLSAWEADVLPLNYNRKCTNTDYPNSYSVCNMPVSESASASSLSKPGTMPTCLGQKSERPVAYGRNRHGLAGFGQRTPTDRP